MSRLYGYQLLLMLLLGTVASSKVNAATANELTLIVKGQPMTIEMSKTTVITYTDNTLHIKTNAESTDVPVAAISGGAFPKVVHGDVNGDYAVDVADIASIISVMASATTPEASASGNADVNHDGAVDVADIATTISIMAGK